MYEPTTSTRFSFNDNQTTNLAVDKFPPVSERLLTERRAETETKTILRIREAYHPPEYIDDVLRVRGRTFSRSESNAYAGGETRMISPEKTVSFAPKRVIRSSRRAPGRRVIRSPFEIAYRFRSKRA